MSELRCKVGDLAYVTKSDFPENIGAVVEVVEFFGEDFLTIHGPSWEVRSVKPLTGFNFYFGVRTTTKILSPDAWLRPIRDQQGDDETLTWAGKPNSQTQRDDAMRDALTKAHAAWKTKRFEVLL